MERVLTLDISSKTGWSIGEASSEGYKLIDYGLIGPIEKPEAPYPMDYVYWAENVFALIREKIFFSDAKTIVIEETTKGSKNNFSQKILEFIHFLVAKLFADMPQPVGFKIVYLMTGEWRSAVNARMTKEESKKNAKARKIKEKTGAKLAKDENGKVIGRVTKKHVNVRRANDLFGLNLKIKDNDKADAILLGKAYHEIYYKGFKRESQK